MTTWHEVIGEPTLGDAILDRIVHNAYRLELDGPSMRKIKASEATEPAASPVAALAADSKPAKGVKKSEADQALRPPPWVNRDLPPVDYGDGLCDLEQANEALEIGEYIDLALVAVDEEVLAVRRARASRPDRQCRRPRGDGHFVSASSAPSPRLIC